MIVRQHRAGPGGFPDAVVARGDHPVRGAAAVRGVGQPRHPVDLKIEQSRIIARHQVLAHLDRLGNDDRNGKGRVALALGRRAGEGEQRRQTQFVRARLAPARAGGHVEKAVVVRVHAGQGDGRDVVIDRVARAVDVAADVLNAGAFVHAGARADRRAVGVVVARAGVIQRAGLAGVAGAVKVDVTASAGAGSGAASIGGASAGTHPVIVERLVRQDGAHATAVEGVAAVLGNVDAHVVPGRGTQLHLQRGVERDRVSEKSAAIVENDDVVDAGDADVVGAANQVAALELIVDVFHAAVGDLRLRLGRIRLPEEQAQAEAHTRVELWREGPSDLIRQAG